jgi:hypothetical protein
MGLNFGNILAYMETKSGAPIMSVIDTKRTGKHISIFLFDNLRHPHFLDNLSVSKDYPYYFLDRDSGGPFYFTQKGQKAGVTKHFQMVPMPVFIEGERVYPLAVISEASANEAFIEHAFMLYCVSGIMAVRRLLNYQYNNCEVGEILFLNKLEKIILSEPQMPFFEFIKDWIHGKREKNRAYWGKYYPANHGRDLNL